ncbi:MAG: cell envelope integrity protein CreD [Pseudomonadaceae bacterium]|nr:cell envelope integrity protein CreD [Pseudomonadaceae bacterium]
MSTIHTQEPQFGPSRLTSIRDSVAFKFCLIGVLSLLLLIPLALVEGVADERQSYFFDVSDDIAASWGPALQLLGPVALVPVTVMDRREYTDDSGELRVRERRVRRHLIIPPETQNVSIALEHEWRQRSVYNVPVYRANVAIDATFARPDIDNLDLPDMTIDWQGAQLVVGLSDVRRVVSAEPVLVTTGEITATQALRAGNSVPGIDGDIMQAPFHFSDSLVSANTRFNLRGSQSIASQMIGRQSSLALASTWPHPSFFGHQLPDKHDIRSDGVTANWQTGGIARGLPDAWLASSEQRDLAAPGVGMRLFDPVTPYTLIDRGMKYGLLFIALTFVLVVTVEMLTGRSLHIAQYAVLGLGIAVFFQVLLALSEHIAFGSAYAVATSVLTLMMAFYAAAIAGSRLAGLAMASVQVALYGVLYVLLQMESYTLITGTAVVLIAFGLVMIATRRLGDAQAAPERAR